jgi:hypothetical protein
MIVPSILTMAIGAAALAAFAALLRYVANEARELARTRARASESEKPIGASSFRDARSSGGLVRGGRRSGPLNSAVEAWKAAESAEI